MTYINIQFNNVRVNRWLIYIKQNLGNSPEINSHLEYNVLGFFFNDFFFYQGFLSRTLTTHRTAGEERGPSFIPLYHSHPLTSIQTFICNFACEMTITYFNRLYLPDCYSMRLTTLSNYHLVGWWCDVTFLFAYVMIWF